MRRTINFIPRAPKFKKVFENTGGEYGTFTGMYAAEKWLRENGFGFGSLCFPCPYIAITKEEYNLPYKIHNFDMADISMMAGVIYSIDYRNGKVEVWLYDEYLET